MIGQISASNQLRTSSEHVRSQLRTSTELARNMFGASSEPASVMEFGFYDHLSTATLTAKGLIRLRVTLYLLLRYLAIRVTDCQKM